MLFPALISFSLSGLLFLALHVAGGGSFPPPLSAAEERECLQKIAQGDPAARSSLIEHNLRLVAHVIKKYYASIRDQDDLISIGTIGLIKAVNTFDAEKGARFSTYAARCIENAILT
ncbi:MAG: sigma-70 family RNA polymerase sigma factor [Oscillospiraceae bacterium]|nr:sigma-70 family RNA polymerase sigma factor [Oscillospiraceae bacterium]